MLTLRFRRKPKYEFSASVAMEVAADDGTTLSPTYSFSAKRLSLEDVTEAAKVAHDPKGFRALLRAAKGAKANGK